jgi:flavin-dependent dehydrogenase
MRFDVAIIGAGPAGSLLGMLLARRSCRVALFDQSPPGAFCIGETLPPQATATLSDLALLDGFRSSTHLPAPGIVSVWGGQEPVVNDFFLSSAGNGWHIDRPAFNGMLRDAASAAGATLFARTSVASISRISTGWEIQTGGSSRSIECRFLVDAGGRRRTVPPLTSEKLPSRRTYDRLISIVASNPAGPQASTYTLIEAVEEGWFYTALVPGGNYVVTFNTDADLFASRRADAKQFLDAQLRQAPWTQARTNRFPCRNAIFSAGSSCRDRVFCLNWLAVGDAARSYDPLSGLGLMNAMQMAIEAAPCILDALAGRLEPFRAFESEHQQAFIQYRRAYAEYYGMERRWPASPFWMRRDPSNAGSRPNVLPAVDAARRSPAVDIRLQ